MSKASGKAGQCAISKEAKGRSDNQESVTNGDDADKSLNDEGSITEQGKKTSETAGADHTVSDAKMDVNSDEVNKKEEETNKETEVNKNEDSDKPEGQSSVSETQQNVQCSNNADGKTTSSADDHQKNLNSQSSAPDSKSVSGDKPSATTGSLPVSESQGASVNSVNDSVGTSSVVGEGKDIAAAEDKPQNAGSDSADDSAMKDTGTTAVGAVEGMDTTESGEQKSTTLEEASEGKATINSDSTTVSSDVPVKSLQEKTEASAASTANSSASKGNSEGGKSKTPSKVLKKTSVDKSVPQSSTKSPSSEPSKNISKAATKSDAEKKEKGTTQEEKESADKVKRITPCDKTLWVSSLSNKTRAADLKALFSKHGKVSTAKILTNSKTPGARCYGLVTMVTSKDALMCIKHLHHTELHGRVISVEKTRLALKKQPSAAKKTPIKVSNAARAAEKDKNKSDKKEESSEKLTEGKVESGKESNKTSKPDKKSEKGESASKENKSEKKSPAADKTASKSNNTPKKRSTSETQKGTSKEKEERSRHHSRSSKGKDDRSRNRSRASKDKDDTSRKRSRSAREKNRSKSRDRRRPVPSRPQNRVRTRSPIVRENRNFRDRHGNLITRPAYRNARVEGRFGNRFGNDMQKDRELVRDREMERKNRQETLRLERERERLKQEREELEREKARVLRLEKEQQRLEREKLAHEMEELRKYSLILNMTESHDSKRTLDREEMWDDRKRQRMHDWPSSVSHNTNSRERRDIRHDTNDQSHISRYYDSSGRRPDRSSYHASGSGDGMDRPPTWGNSISQEDNKYGASNVVPGIWARMDVPPPPIPQQQQRWGGMDQGRVQQHPGPMGHQPPPNPMIPPPNQVVTFVGGGNNPNSNNPSNMPGQYPSNRYNSNSVRRF